MDPTHCGEKAIRKEASLWGRGNEFDSLFERQKCCTEEGRAMLGDGIQIESATHPASWPIGTGGPFPSGKQPEGEADHSPSTIAEVKIVDLYTHSIIFVHGAVFIELSTETTLPFCLCAVFCLSSGT
jgi:hypothetical protein